MARILVIDDTKNILKMVQIALTQGGHEVQTVDNGTQGLEYFGDGNGWDLVLLDQRMPGLEGRELTHEMRRRAPQTRLVMMTSFPSIELASDVITAGAVDFLRKPFTKEILLGTVKVTLERPLYETHVPEAHAPAKELVGKLVEGGAAAKGDDTLSDLPPRPAGLPPVSFYLNGFTFWPVKITEAEREVVQNLPVSIAFQVCGPANEKGRCVVGITPHVEQAVTALAKPTIRDNFLWDVLCREPLANYLWENASLPPTLLPIYELSANQFDYIRRLNNAEDDF
jgi:FixJ family two-component response regulator